MPNATPKPWLAGLPIFALGIAVVTVVPGCSGAIFIPDETYRPCVSDGDCGNGFLCSLADGRCVAYQGGACSFTVPDGDCPVGYDCRRGVCECVSSGACLCPPRGCVADGGVDAPEQGLWCECEAGQGCDSYGYCVDLVSDGPSANTCAVERPTGLCLAGRACCESGARCCPSGEVCVGDHCVPIVRECSATDPDGWCPPSLSCHSERCTPTSSCACGDSRGTPDSNTCCPAGQRCDLDAGVCSDQACTTGFAGICEADFVCTTDGCSQLDCSLDHLLGACETSELCSKIGECIPQGTCQHDGDCLGDGAYCSVAERCLPDGSCALDADCEEKLADDFGPGFECQSGACAPRAECPGDLLCAPGYYCSGEQNCLQQPACDVDLDCGDTDSFFCSFANECAEVGSCVVDQDCERLPGTFCGSGKECLVPVAECFQNIDCPPEHDCVGETCVPKGSATTCDTNDYEVTGCPEDLLRCCPAGKQCCGEAERCSTNSPRVCIPQGSCVVDADCPQNFACERFACVPTKPCDDCDPATERCTSVQNAAGAWVSGCILSGTCATAADCYDGEVCTSLRACRPIDRCGFEALDIGSRVPPNVLIVLDRSSSMNICGAGTSAAGPCGYNTGSCTASSQCDQAGGEICYPEDGGVCINPMCSTDLAGGTTTRWDEAYGAIDSLTNQFAGEASFGLALYPKPSGNEDCPLTCNWLRCQDSQLNTAGDVSVPLGEDTRTEILQALTDTEPGGGTPTASTLRGILSLEDRAQLDATDRANVVVLVTDGEAIADLEVVKTCAPPCPESDPAPQRDGSETDVNCGGLCPGCADGKRCLVGDDCQSGLCRGGLCRPVSCGNSLPDAGELGVDCGPDCGPCPETTPCTAPLQCQSVLCVDGMCAGAACDDTVTNGSETDVDCGGGCSPCADGQECLAADDCESGLCQGGRCRPAACDNATHDGNETDVDCGGDGCDACIDGADCSVGGDCQSGACSGGVCTRDSCENGTLDPGEVDVDCGGGTCPPCPGAALCTQDSDCLSQDCRNCDDATAPQACRVDAALDQLYAASPRIKTFVVGFAFGDSSINLNCHATHGRTPRREESACADITEATCDEPDVPCYFEAEDEVTLSDAFETIMDRVASCDYPFPPDDLDVPNEDLLFFYLEDRSTIPPTRTRVHRGIGWEYFRNENQIKVFDASCDSLKQDNVFPLVILGCPDGSGS